MGGMMGGVGGPRMAQPRMTGRMGGPRLTGRQAARKARPGVGAPPPAYNPLLRPRRTVDGYQCEQNWVYHKKDGRIVRCGAFCCQALGKPQLQSYCRVTTFFGHHMLRACLPPSLLTTKMTELSAGTGEIQAVGESVMEDGIGEEVEGDDIRGWKIPFFASLSSPASLLGFAFCVAALIGIAVTHKFQHKRLIHCQQPLLTTE